MHKRKMDAGERWSRREGTYRRDPTVADRPVSLEYSQTHNPNGFGARLHRNFSPEVIITIALIVLAAAAFAGAKGYF